MKILSFIFFSFISLQIFSQVCKVNVVQLDSVYHGHCKHGLADGQGFAYRTDSFVGNFLKGYPHGYGRYYDIKNNTVYEGHFSKGIKDGKGKILYFRPSLKDSVVEGFWKHDHYIGSHAYPFKVTGKSGLVRTAHITRDNQTGTENTIVIEITSENAGNLSITQNVRKPELTNISVIEGTYTNINRVESQVTRNFYYLLNVTYPFKATLLVNESSVDVEINQPGSYKIFVKLRFDDL